MRTAPTVPFLLGIAVLSLGLSLAGSASAEEVSIRVHATGATQPYASRCARTSLIAF